LPKVLKQRNALLTEERTPDLTGMYDRSIAYDRFILKWKKFADLDRTAFRQPR